MKTTALASAHSRAGARMVPFAGWKMPVQYVGILEEAKAVRAAGGLFDLGHMGRVFVDGADATALLQRVQTNDVTKIAPGSIRYSLFLTDRGTAVDDILVYRRPDAGGFFLVVNAANTEVDLQLLRQAAAGFADARVDDATDALGMFAIQGPIAQAVVQELTDFDLGSLGYYKWAAAEVAGVAMHLSRTGYTGEDGFEFYLPQPHVERVWEAMLARGAGRGLVPAGLGARDILRLEAGMPLYGHEIDRDTNPLEAGLGFAVKFTHDFVGRAALERWQQTPEAERRTLVGLVSDGRRIPRQGHAVRCGGRRVGTVCSGGASPTLGTNIATTLVPGAVGQPGTAVEIELKQGVEVPGRVVALPFYKRARP